MKIARWLWAAAFVVSLGIWLGALPAYWQHGNRIDPAAEFAGVQQFAAWLGVVLSLGCAALCLALAVLLFVKKSSDAMALFLSFYLLLYGILLAGPLEMFLPFWFPQAGDLGVIVQGAIFPLPTLVLILIFPNGHFLPRWSRWLVLIAVGVLVFVAITVRDYSEIARINTIEIQIAYAVYGTLLVLAFVIQAYRYRRIYTPLERQQTKWVLYGFLLGYFWLILVSIPYYYLQSLPPGTPKPWWSPLNSAGWWLGLSLQPLAITLAILRARLWEIDLFIRRTLVYSIITAMLALFYIGAVILLQQLFHALTGAGDDLAIIVSTLAIAALFHPLRNRVQGAIDHRFYRRKYDTQQVLERFAVTARDEVELEKLAGELLNVVSETMQPTHVSLWLKKTDDQEPQTDKHGSWSSVAGLGSKGI